VNPHKPVKRTKGGVRLAKVKAYRDKHQLNLPIGPMAAKLPFRQGQPPAPPGGPPPAAP
jgi:hypothetical protein